MSSNDTPLCEGRIYVGEAVEEVEERSCIDVRLISRNRQEVIENPRRRCGRIIEEDGGECDLER